MPHRGEESLGKTSRAKNDGSGSARSAPGGRRGHLDLGDDVNGVVGGLLRDLAFIQTSREKNTAYKRAAVTVMRLDAQLPTYLEPNGALTKFQNIGPSSTRVIMEILQTGASPTVENAVMASSRSADVLSRRALREHFLSRAKVREVLAAAPPKGPRVTDYLGDLQMHSEWSDGALPLTELAEACRARGYRYSAVTDHSHGLKIAGGMTMIDAFEQHRQIDRLNADYESAFRLIKGVEANIAADGSLDLSDDEAARFELVLAAPHSNLRSADDQTGRLLRAIANPRVHILAHPRGRVAGSRAGLVAKWKRVFEAAAKAGVAVEIDGDPSRQDLDHTLARQAADEFDCLFALDSDAHDASELSYAETALAHASLAGIRAERIVNCWELEKLLAWTRDRQRGASSS